MIFFITACLKLFWFVSERIYREFVHVFWIGRRYEKEVCDRGAAYVHQLIRNISENKLIEIDPIYLKDKFIGFDASLASIKINGEVEFFRVSISGLNSLKKADSCSLTAEDNLLHVNANMMAGPLSFDSWVVFRFLGFEQKFLVKGNLSLVEFLCKFKVVPKEDKNGLFEGLFIRELKGIELWVQEGSWLLKWHLNLGITLAIYLLKPFLRNIVEYLLECWLKDAFSKFKFPIEECEAIFSSKSSEDRSPDIVSPETEMSDSSNHGSFYDFDSIHSDSGKSISSEKESDAENQSKPILFTKQSVSSRENFSTAKTTANLHKPLLLELEAENDLVTMAKQLKNNTNYSLITNGHLHKNSPSCDKDENYETAITQFNERDDEIRKLFAEVGNLINNGNGSSIPNGSSMKNGHLRKIVPSIDLNKKTFETARTQFIEGHDETKKLWSEVQNQLKNEANGPSITNGHLHNVSSTGMNEKNLESTRIEFIKRHDEVNKLWEEVKLASQALKLDSDQISLDEIFNPEFLKFVPKDEDGISACPYKNAIESKSFLDSNSIDFVGQECMTELKMFEKNKQDNQTISNDNIPATGNYTAKNVKTPSQNGITGSDTLKSFFNNSLTVMNERATYNNIVTLDNTNGILRKSENIVQKNGEKLLDVEKDTAKSSLKRCSETLLEHSSKSRKRFTGSATNETEYENFLEMVRESSKLAKREEMHKDALDLWSPNKTKGSHRILNSNIDTFVDLLSYSAMMPKYRSSNCIAEENLASINSKSNENMSNDQDVYVESHQLDACEDQFIDMLLYSAMIPKSRGLTNIVVENIASNKSENNKNLFSSHDKDGCEESHQQSSCEDQFVDMIQFSAMMPKSIHSTDVLEISINEPDESGDEPNIIESTEDECLVSAEFLSPSEDPFASSLLIYPAMIPKSKGSTHDEDPNTKVEPVALMQSEITRKETIKHDVITESAGNGLSITRDVTAATCDAEVSSKENHIVENKPSAEETNTTLEAACVNGKFYKKFSESKPKHTAVSPKQFFIDITNTTCDAEVSSKENRAQENWPNAEETNTTREAASVNGKFYKKLSESKPKHTAVSPKQFLIDITNTTCDAEVSSKENRALENKHSAEETNTTCEAASDNGKFCKMLCESKPKCIAADPKQFAASKEIRSQVKFSSVDNKTATRISENRKESPSNKENTITTFDTVPGMDIGRFQTEQVVAATEVQNELPNKETIERGAITRVEDIGDYFSMQTSNGVATCVREVSNREDHTQEDIIKKEKTDTTYDTVSGMDIQDFDVQKHVVAIRKQLVATVVQSSMPTVENDTTNVEDAGDYFSMQTSNGVATGVEVSNIEDHSQENLIKKEITFVPTSDKDKFRGRTIEVHGEQVEASFKQSVGSKDMRREAIFSTESVNGANRQSKVSSIEGCAQDNLVLEAANEKGVEENLPHEAEVVANGKPEILF